MCTSVCAGVCVRVCVEDVLLFACCKIPNLFYLISVLLLLLLCSFSCSAAAAAYFPFYSKYINATPSHLRLPMSRLYLNIVSHVARS